LPVRLSLRAALSLINTVGASEISLGYSWWKTVCD